MGGPVEDEIMRSALERFDALLPVKVASQGRLVVWARAGRILVQREHETCWRIGWFAPDGIDLYEGLVLEAWLTEHSYRSVWIYVEELSNLLDICRPLAGETDDDTAQPGSTDDHQAGGSSAA